MNISTFYKFLFTTILICQSWFDSQRCAAFPFANENRALTIFKIRHHHFSAKLSRPNRSVLETFSSIISLFDFVFDRILDDDSKNSKLTRLVDELNAKIVNIQEILGDLKVHTNYQNMETQYKESVQIIIHSLQILSLYHETRSEMSKTDLVGVRLTLEKSVYDLFDGMMGNKTIGADILEALKSYHSNHRRNFLKSATAILALAESGIATLAATYKLNDLCITSPECLQQILNIRGQLVRKNEYVMNRIQSIAEGEKPDKDKIETEMRKIMRNGANLNLKEINQQLHHHLMDKYDTGSWSVLTFEAGKGEHHATSGRTYQVTHEGKRNAVAVFKPHNTRKLTTDQLKSIDQDIRSFYEEKRREHRCLGPKYYSREIKKLNPKFDSSDLTLIIIDTLWAPFSINTSDHNGYLVFQNPSSGSTFCSRPQPTVFVIDSDSTLNFPVIGLTPKVYLTDSGENLTRYLELEIKRLRTLIGPTSLTSTPSTSTKLTSESISTRSTLISTSINTNMPSVAELSNNSRVLNAKPYCLWLCIIITIYFLLF